MDGPEGEGGWIRLDWANRCDETADTTQNEDIGVRRVLVFRFALKNIWWRGKGEGMHACVQLFIME